MTRRTIALSTVVALLAGCASHPSRLAIAPPAPAPLPVPVAATMPAGAYPGMVIPARLADGSYVTPNRGLGTDGMVWHMRAALNVAALACRGAQGDAIVTGYNTMLGRERLPLAAAQTHYAASFHVAGGAADGGYDDAMTRLYNFFSQSQVRDSFCAAAAGVLAEAATVTPEALPAFARDALPALERPFTDFYAAYDAWRSGAPAPFPQAVIAVANTPAVTSAPPAPAPRLRVDPSVFAN